MEVYCLKLTPYIGDGNTCVIYHNLSIFDNKFETNPVYRGRKLVDKLRFLKKAIDTSLKLTPYIGDGNLPIRIP